MPVPTVRVWQDRVVLKASDTTFLLGAGSSVEAGVPTSFALTQKIVEAIAPPTKVASYPPAQALNLALGAIIAHDSARGLPVFQGVDVERLFSAVQMLAERQSLEIAPFVQRWNPGLDAIGRARRLPAFFDKDLRRALASTSAFELERVFQKGVQSLMDSPSNGSEFARLESDMIEALRTCLQVAPGASDYLSPMFTLGGGPVRVATLNYDHAIEMAAYRAGATVATGITLWDGGLEWDWEAGQDVQLLKLHGSIDWYYERRHAGWGTLPEKVVVPFVPFKGRGHQFDELAVVFGQRGKLRSDGPFLAMLTGLDRWLQTTTNLVIVGYSFRDDHINELIRRWFNRAYRPKVIIVNPEISEGSLRSMRDNSFLFEFGRGLSTLTDNAIRVVSRHDVLPMGTREGLARLSQQGS